MTTSPGSGEVPPPVTLPAPPVPPAPAFPPAGAAVQAPPPRPHRRLWVWAVLALALVVPGSAAAGSVVAMRNNHAAPAPQSPSPSASPATPQFSAAEVAAAKKNLCQVFGVSVRDQEGEGGLRMYGQLNMPVVLRSLNSVSAVQNALVPAVPPDVASAARKYISTTLDQTTAAMGNTPTSEGNRLTDVRNDAIDALLGLCGLPQ